MIKIIYLASVISYTGEKDLDTWDECLDLAETIHKVQPSYAVFCCRDGECEEVEFGEGE